MANYQTILYKTRNSVATITLNRPERYNAITNQMLSEVSKALKTAGRDRQVRAIILTGAGRGFCAGQDLSAFSADRPPNHLYEHITKYYQPAIEQFTAVEKPIIGAIDGVAAGAGASLALACDLRVMSSTASLLLAFSNIGLIPDAGATWFLVQAVGYSRAFEIAIEGEKIPAGRCLELGLTNKVVEPDELLPATRAWAEKLAQRPTYALGLSKRAMRKAAALSLSQAIEYEAQLQQLASESEDFAEGVSAFVEKRRPVFTGAGR